MIAVPTDQGEVGNRVLSSLPAREWELIRHLLVPVRLVTSQTLIEPNQIGDHALFIEAGVASLFTTLGERRIQVAMIGCEGIVGSLGLLGEPAIPMTVTMTLAGHALRIPLSMLRSCVEQCPSLRTFWLGHLRVIVADALRLAAHNAGSTLEQRCANWLLAVRARVSSPDLAITHESLATMLGVFRSAVTISIASLQDRGLVSTGRGRITILSESGLQELAMELPRNLTRAPKSPPRQGHLPSAFTGQT